MIGVDLFCDGGCVGRNPSPLGGTWAYVAVDDAGQLSWSDSGWLGPKRCGGAVSNNVAELYAAVKALESVVPSCLGKLHTDSAVTRFRLLGGGDLRTVPGWLRRRLEAVRWVETCGVVLLGGHATKRELRDGRRARNGLPVSEWNGLCDRMCRRAAQRRLEREGG